jgi:glutamate N-acetyltransferase/amino-acid N-acetyltransferase
LNQSGFKIKITGKVKMDNIVVSGFQATGIAAGIKKNGKKDLGLIYSIVPASVAGVFTRNRVQAAPVVLDRERIKSGTCQAIVVNSGNANCCTGQQGLSDAIAMAGFVAEGLGIVGDTILVASTGVIGEPLPLEKIKSAVPKLVDTCRPEGISDLAKAIMTTDTMPKIVSAQGRIDGRAFQIAGVAKGAGMIRPDMATMLCFVISDIQASSAEMQEMLQLAADRSFNRITIDGDTSTNDMVLFMANGTSGAVLKEPSHREIVQDALDDVLLRLAKLCVKDGEGATKLVEIVVRGAATNEDARMVAETVSNSNLVKTALFGEDANWGRILAAIGRSGASIDPDSVEIYFDDVQMVKNGIGSGKLAERHASAVLKQAEFVMTIDLHLGHGRASMFTCDFSVEYVKINADYRT